VEHCLKPDQSSSIIIFYFVGIHFIITTLHLGFSFWVFTTGIATQFLHKFALLSALVTLPINEILLYRVILTVT